MTQFFVQLPAGDTITLDLDLKTTTVAAVKATVDAHLESIWRTSGVRILRSDLPFCGVTLRYRNRLLAMDKVLSSCKVGKGSTLNAQWPRKSEKEERRKRYGKGWDDESLERRTKDGRKIKRVEREEKGVEKKALHGAARRSSSRMVENTTQSTTETGGDEQTSSVCVSGDRPGEETEFDADGKYADAGAQDLSEEVAHEEQDEQQAEEEGQEERVNGEVEQDDPFADEDDDKENRDPMIAHVEGPRVNQDPEGERFLFDESNSGFDLMEEVVEF